MLLNLDRTLASGLWPELPTAVQTLELAEPPFASGAYGELYRGIRLNGTAFGRPLAVKILREDGAGVAQAGYATIRKLQAQIAHYEQNRLGQNRPSLAGLPLLRALPQLSFEGRLPNGEAVRGYVAELLPVPPFGELSELFDHDDPAERKRRRQAFYALSQNQRLLLGADLVRGFHALTHLHFIHADLNPQNLLVSANPPSLCLIDYDSGAVTAATTDQPQTFGKAGDWLAPEVLQQLVQPGTARVKVNLDTDTWAVAIGLHYLLFAMHPLFFLRSMGLTDIQTYLSKFKWPEIAVASPLFRPGAAQHYAAYRQQLATLPPDLLNLFAATINLGALNPNQRPGYSRWLTVFNRLLAVEATIHRFDGPTAPLTDLAPVRLTWDVSGAVALHLSGVGNVTGQTEAVVAVKADTVFTLEATSLGGQTTRKECRVETDKRPPEITLTTNHAEVLVGADVRLTWRTQRATRVILHINGKAAPALGSGASGFTHQPGGHTRYDLRAESAFGVAASAHTDVAVHPRPVLTDFAPAHRQVKPRQATELRWQAQHCQRLMLHLDGRTQDVTGTSAYPIQPTASGKFKLVAVALDGRTTLHATTQIDVVPPVKIKKFHADRAFVLPTVAVQLSWQASHETSLTLLPDGTDVTGKTSCQVYPNQSTTYTLVARNALFTAESEPLRVEVQSPPRLSNLTLPAPPRLALSPPPSLGHWQPHDPARARRQLFEGHVLPPAPPGAALHPIGNLYARLRAALNAQVGRLFAPSDSTDAS